MEFFKSCTNSLICRGFIFNLFFKKGFKYFFEISKVYCRKFYTSHEETSPGIKILACKVVQNIPIYTFAWGMDQTVRRMGEQDLHTFLTHPVSPMDFDHMLIP